MGAFPMQGLGIQGPHNNWVDASWPALKAHIMWSQPTVRSQRVLFADSKKWHMNIADTNMPTPLGAADATRHRGNQCNGVMYDLSTRSMSYSQLVSALTNPRSFQ